MQIKITSNAQSLCFSFTKAFMKKVKLAKQVLCFQRRIYVREHNVIKEYKTNIDNYFFFKKMFHWSPSGFKKSIVSLKRRLNEFLTKPELQ